MKAAIRKSSNLQRIIIYGFMLVLLVAVALWLSRPDQSEIPTAHPKKQAIAQLQATHNKLTKSLTEADKNDTKALLNDIYDLDVKLLSLAPKNLKLKQQLVTTLNKIGDHHLSEDEHSHALKRYQHALKLSEAMISTDPSNLLFQVQQTDIHSRIGDVHYQQENNTESLHHHQLALEKRQELLAKNPNHSKYQHSVATSYNKIGLLQCVLPASSRSQALQTFHKAESIITKLLKTSPENSTLKRDLALTYYHKSETYLLHDISSAISDLKKALKLLSELQQRDDLHPKDLHYIPEIREKINAFSQ